MTFDIYAAVRILAVSFAHFLIGGGNAFCSSVSFYSFLYGILFYCARCLVSQMNPMRNNLTNLDLNPGQRVCLVPDLVFFLHGVGFSFGVRLSAHESCDGYGGSLLP